MRRKHASPWSLLDQTVTKFFGLGLHQSFSYVTGGSNPRAPSRFNSGSLAPIPGDGDGRGAFDLVGLGGGGLLNQGKSPSVSSQMHGLIELFDAGELPKRFKHQWGKDLGIFFKVLSAPTWGSVQDPA